MKSLATRVGIAAALAFFTWMVLAGATASKSPSTSRAPDKLIILTTTDVKGRTSPCG